MAKSAENVTMQLFAAPNTVESNQIKIYLFEQIESKFIFWNRNAHESESL